MFIDHKRILQTNLRYLSYILEDGKHFLRLLFLFFGTCLYSLYFCYIDGLPGRFPPSDAYDQVAMEADHPLEAAPDIEDFDPMLMWVGIMRLTEQFTHDAQATCYEIFDFCRTKPNTVCYETAAEIIEDVYTHMCQNVDTYRDRVKNSIIEKFAYSYNNKTSLVEYIREPSMNIQDLKSDVNRTAVAFCRTLPDLVSDFWRQNFFRITVIKKQFNPK